MHDIPDPQTSTFAQPSNRTAAILEGVKPQSTVVAVIDIQNDFCSADGALGALGADVSECASVARRIEANLSKMREVTRAVCFFRLVYDPAKMTKVQRERLLVGGKPFICAPGGSGADLFLLKPMKGEHMFTKYRYSAFTSVGFRRMLSSLAIETVIVVGVDTHVCVEGTVRHGYDLGYKMVVLSDLVGTRSAERPSHERALHLIEKYFGGVVESGPFLQRMGAQGTPTHSGDWHR